MAWSFGGWSGTTFPVAQAILSGVRIDSTMSQINRIIAAQRSNGLTLEDAELQGAFSHIQQINTLRYDITHYGVHGRETGPPTVTNIFHGVAPDRLRVTAVTADALDTMTSDAQKAANILTFYLMREIMPLPALEELTTDKRGLPWLYTPPLQSRDPKSGG